MLDLENAAEFKLFAAALISALALVGGGAPLLLRGFHQAGDASRSSSTSERVVAITSVLNMFAGGIFLSGAVLHLLPDAQENAALATWMCASEDGCFKWANFFFGCGFLLVLLLEVFAHAVQDSLAEKRHPSTSLQQHSARELTSLATDEHQLALQQSHFRHHESCSSIETDASASPQARAASETHVLVAAGPPHHDYDIESGAHGHKHLTGPTHYGATTRKQLQHGDDISHAHSHAHGLMVDAGGNPLLALVVFAALSFHSIMEGMGIGASSHAAWDVLAAVLAHKSLAAFALAQELLQHRVAMRQVAASVGAFSLMTPAGILFGALLAGSAGSGDGQQESVVSGVCTALAGGTFLFVATAEVLPQELRSRCDLPLKCGALLAGFSAMGVLSLWA